jgi:hypothetical protein
MARKRKNILIDLIGTMIFLGFLFFYAIPKFQQTLTDSTQQMLYQSMQISQNAIAQQKANEQARANEALKPVYVDKPHQGYTIRKAEIRTCEMAQCTVVGYLPKETMVKWDKVENGFVNYDSVYYVKLADVKQLF